MQGTNNGESWSQECKIIGKSTEGKGQIIFEIASILSHEKGYYIGIFDDDILIRISDINRALIIGKNKSFATFQPSLSRSSYFSHKFTLNCFIKKFLPKSYNYRYVPWVEIMVPIIKSELLILSLPFLKNNFSAYGLDCFVFPMLAITNGISGGHAVIDAAICTHLRDMRTNKRIFSNGMNAAQELDKVKEDCIEYLHNRGIKWEKSKKLRSLFKKKVSLKNFLIKLMKKLFKKASIVKSFLKSF